MSEIPSLPYDRIIRALQRDGWSIYVKEEAISGYKDELKTNF